MTYIYVKKQSKFINKYKLKKQFLTYSFLVIGFFLFGSAIFPILKFQIEYSLKFNQIINPLSTKFYNRSGNILGDNTTDYTQLSNWFVSDNQSTATSTFFTSQSSSTYSISIPKLKIINAEVDIGSMDLKKSLIQYPKTALPGQLGNAVIFGHSVLPQFFNPKSYLTIFSTLYKLKTGDEILVDFDNIHYKYVVEEMFEVQPTDLSVLEQRFDSRTLTLITCSPPGTYLRRLIVKAKL